MVKIEIDEEKLRGLRLQSNADKITKIVNSKYKIKYANTNEIGWFAEILEPFVYTKRKYLFWKEKVESDGGFIKGHLVFEIDTNHIHLHGSEEDMKEIAEKLEQNGYEVTIFV